MAVTSSLLSTPPPGSTLGTLVANMTSVNGTDDACTKSYSAFLSGMTSLMLVLLILLTLTGILFIIFVRKFAHRMDIWLTALLLELLIWVLGKMIQEFSSTGLCILTQNMMFLGLMCSVWTHLGMAFEKTRALYSTKPMRHSNRTVYLYLAGVFFLVLLVIIILIIIMGPNADLNRGPNMCKEGPTRVMHTAIQGTKAACYLLAGILIVIFTLIIIWKLLHTKFGRKGRLIGIVAFTGLICAFSWFMLSLPLLFLGEAGSLGFHCTESLAARYYHVPAACLALLLILLYAWSCRHFMDSLKTQATVTARYFRGTSTQST
ncbi:BILF1 [macacine gammaherpesvirus 10]|uniref:BILF1 n=1 Tax=macacine gammaherpesvirus 10 TaxID=2560569 RepID=A0A0S0DXS7_9GAMA|nr:BILF1 [macacine gammaherpesvirus 10]ALF03279.1 BILF1 [macacine gammaherpesvirus 10]